MSDMVGHPRRRLLGSDLKAITLLSGYVGLVARAHVLESSDAAFREFGTIAGPSFCCRMRLVPFDQTAEEVEFEGVDTEGRRTKRVVGAALLRLELWPVCAFLLVGSRSDESPQRR